MDIVEDGARPWRATLVAALAVAVTAAAPRAAHATGAGGAGDPLAPAKMLSGPSLSQTGKVGSSTLEGEPPARTMRPAPRLETRPEKTVAAADTADPDGVPAAAPKVALPRPVQQQIAAHLRELNDCRRQIARAKHVPVAHVPAGALLLRWKIDLDGTVSATEVVEKTPVDPAVMECVREAIAKWTFPVPEKGPLPIERRYQFRVAR